MPYTPRVFGAEFLRLDGHADEPGTKGRAQHAVLQRAISCPGPPSFSRLVQAKQHHPAADISHHRMPSHRSGGGHLCRSTRPKGAGGRDGLEVVRCDGRTICDCHLHGSLFPRRHAQIPQAHELPKKRCRMAQVQAEATWWIGCLMGPAWVNGLSVRLGNRETIVPPTRLT